MGCEISMAMKYRTENKRTLSGNQLMLITILFFSICPEAWSSETLEIKRHICIYGASDFLKKQQDMIARNYGLLITEYWKHDEVRQIKTRNPAIKVFFYRDLIGMFNDYQDYPVASAHPDWFVCDLNTGNRIQRRTFGWYLMDITNQDFRNALVGFIKSKIINHPEFDGVFLDDATQAINPDLYTVEGLNDARIPQFERHFHEAYRAGLIAFIHQLKQEIGSKLVILNTDGGKDIIDPADGVMFEGFVHGSWQKKEYQKSFAAWKVDIARLHDLVATDKLVLVESGSRGLMKELGPSYRFAVSSYLLCAGPKTSFHYDAPDDRSEAFKTPAMTVHELGEPSMDSIITLHAAAVGVGGGQEMSLYARSFTKGLLIVNPHVYALEIQMPPGYQQKDRPDAKKIVLSPYSVTCWEKSSQSASTPGIH